LGLIGLIRDLGHTVVEARGGAEALTLLADSPDVDVVVSDYKMPRMDGAEFARRLHATRPQLPVLIIIGYTGPRDQVLHPPRLAKPFGQAEVAIALAALVQRHQNVVSLGR